MYRYENVEYEWGLWKSKMYAINLCIKFFVFQQFYEHFAIYFIKLLNLKGFILYDIEKRQ